MCRQQVEIPWATGVQEGCFFWGKTVRSPGPPAYSLYDVTLDTLVLDSSTSDRDTISEEFQKSCEEGQKILPSRLLRRLRHAPDRTQLGPGMVRLGFDLVWEADDMRMLIRAAPTLNLAGVGAAAILAVSLAGAKLAYCLLHSCDYATARARTVPKDGYKGKVVWITGASSGIGESAAVRGPRPPCWHAPSRAGAHESARTARSVCRQGAGQAIRRKRGTIDPVIAPPGGASCSSHRNRSCEQGRRPGRGHQSCDAGSRAR